MTPAIPAMMLSVALMGGLWPFGDDGQPSRRETIGGLRDRDVEMKPAPSVEDAATRARQQYREFLEMSDAHPSLQMEAMRRLGDLNLAAGEQASFDGLEGDAAFYKEAIILYIALLESNPDYADADRILYQLGRTYEAVGESELALQTLDRLVSEYPNSKFVDEAQFRRGETLFVDKRFDEAQSAYAAVIAGGDASLFYEQALYKHGWTLFKQSEHELSLESFLDLLDLRMAGGTQATGTEILEGMSRPDRELVDDTFRVLSITFSYLDGFNSIEAVLNQRGGAYYVDLLYSGLGDLYLDKERYIDAAKTYADFVQRNPTHPRSPDLQVRVVEAYTLAKFPSLVLDAKRDYVDLYGLDSVFWEGRLPEDWPVVVASLKENLTDLAAYDHALAQEGGDMAAYERAAGLYRRYLSYFPEDPDSAQRNFLLAEILFELGRFDEATDEYLRTAYGYGPHEQDAEAAYAALLSSREFESTLSGEELIAWRAAAVDHSLRFADSFPEHEEAGAVLTNVAEELFDNKDLERAVQVAGLVITMQPPAAIDLERTAWTVIAHSRFDLQQYAEAEQAYQHLRSIPNEDAQALAQIDDRIAASVYRQAEAAQATGDVDMAVNHFLRVSAVQPGSGFAPNAVYDAAALLISSAKWPEAVDVLEQFRGTYPDHEFNDDVTQKLAVAYESSGQVLMAGVEYERISTLESVEYDIRREALWRAADLYEQGGAIDEQRRTFSAIVTRYPEPVSESIEARLRLADLAGDAGDYQARVEWLQSIIDADSRAGAGRTDRSRTLAATASLELAAPARDAFLSAKLTSPLKESLMRKRERMEFALAAYGKTAEYGVADVTTAATYEIANLYYHLSKDLIESERPAELSAEELEQYDILLEEQAFPFEEQAIEIFSANANRAAEGIYDEWVRKSFSRLAELMPFRYDKRERSEPLVAQLD